MSRGPKWSDDELELVHQLKTQGVSAAEIGQRIGRSKAAVWDKLQDMRAVEAWNPASIRSCSARFARDFARVHQGCDL